MVAAAVAGDEAGGPGVRRGAHPAAPAGHEGRRSCATRRAAACPAWSTARSPCGTRWRSASTSTSSTRTAACGRTTSAGARARARSRPRCTRASPRCARTCRWTSARATPTQGAAALARAAGRRRGRPHPRPLDRLPGGERRPVPVRRILDRRRVLRAGRHALPTPTRSRWPRRSPAYSDAVFALPAMQQWAAAAAAEPETLDD